MSYVDNEFALRLFSSFRNFKQVSTYPLKLNASCPVCGDSASDSFKARFWYYLYKDSYMVHCFNCDFSAGFQKFLKDTDESMFRDYLLEKRKESIGFQEKPEINYDLSKFKTKIEFIEQLHFCESLDTLPVNHPIIKYVEDRQIPKEQWNRLYFTKQWQDLVNKYKQTFDKPKQECRLVIPIWNADKKIESFQGRALSSKAKQKYMTIKAHEDASKIYGTDRINASSNVYVMEGPIDTLFIPNSIAITGGSLNLESVPYPKQRVWVLDNEPRHPDVKKRVKKLIDQGERVILWDKSPWKAKDINEMITQENATPKQIIDYFESNVVSGLQAQLRFGKWFKV